MKLTQIYTTTFNSSAVNPAHRVSSDITYSLNGVTLTQRDLETLYKDIGVALNGSPTAKEPIPTESYGEYMARQGKF